MADDAPLAATYRLQLHRGFPLAAARGLVDYLARLGVSHLYLSPLLRARSGSLHGYDVVDPTVLDPDRGGEDDLAALVAALRRHGQGLLVDIVPNHMAADADNGFWEDVLAHGPGSPYARWFDIDWGTRRDGPAPILLPVLGDLQAAVLERGELGVARADGVLRVRYFAHRFPLDPATLPLLLDPLAEAPGVEAGARASLAGVVGTLRALPPWRARTAAAGGWRVAAADATRRLADVLAHAPGLAAALDASLEQLGSTSPGRVRLRALLDAQPYRLVYWRRAADEVSYRRFFNVSDLVGVRVEDADVFAATHARLLAWAGAGWLDGVRVDHVDGLREPREYLVRLRDALRLAAPGRRLTVHVEKILSRDERLRADWPVEGTTGYEMASVVDAVLVDPSGAGMLEDWYGRTLGAPGGFAEAARAGKRRILATWLRSDARRLGRQLARVLRAERRSPVPPAALLTRALVEVMVAFPVYRTYAEPSTGRLGAEDRAAIECALRGAEGRAPAAALAAAADVLRTPGASPGRLAFVLRFQQTTGPVIAKGVEDTALYRWLPLVSRNEVGGEPDAPLDGAVDRFHGFMSERAAGWPLALSAATTHDTKRAADVRARLAVLSERAPQWIACVERWSRRNRHLRRRVEGRPAPDRNTEYLLYQTLVGVWPPGGADGPARAALAERVQGYMQKAAREAKVRTSWLTPHAAWEAALDAFVRALFADDGFMADVESTARAIAGPGLWNGLARTLLHLTAPGVPDVYQGDECWLFALTDPDNRRDVDFAARDAALAALEARPAEAALAADLLAHAEDGRAKLHVVRTALQLRREDPALFAGAYVPLAADGERAAHVLAFARQAEGRTAITVAPRLVAGFAGPPVGAAWGDTMLRLPRGAGALRERLAGGTFAQAAAGRLSVAEVLRHLPVALLAAAP